MRNKKMRTLIMGLMTVLMITGVNSVLVNATDFRYSRESSSMVAIVEPADGTSFLEPTIPGGGYIDICVKDIYGNPIFDAVVHVYEQVVEDFIWEGFTDEEGMARCPLIPSVDSDTTYHIMAEADVGEKIIDIVVRNRFLTVSTPATVSEGELFYATVRNQDNEPIAWAPVKMSNEEEEIEITEYTNFNGVAEFTAPFVSENVIFDIEVSTPFRPYYDGDETTIIVTNEDNPEPHTVYGQIRDYDFVPLEDVEVTIQFDGSSVSTFTDEYGDYSIEFTPYEGGETVTVTASYGDLEQTLQVTVNGEGTTHINFWMVEGDGSQYITQGQPATNPLTN